MRGQEVRGAPPEVPQSGPSPDEVELVPQLSGRAGQRRGESSWLAVPWQCLLVIHQHSED
ncbi:FCH and double SH3 domains 1 (predicted), isoform CRA_a [Rattus norvegicus]|uniref:FCH and double SH3 domains 1 (Predicted), isoform CRA_a n=1 Tax=Rattus norvegicus TaxID=10116 RepID=A6J3E1_RAT|nr:FCH and double SH3 domains 1 (predicted), isoform CRA_a [Rattus norvegicus]